MRKSVGEEMNEKSVRKRIVKALQRISIFSIIGLVLTIAGGWFISWAKAHGWNPEIANGVQAIVSITLNFYLNNRYTWPDRVGTTTRVKAIRFLKVKGYTFTYNLVLYRIGQLLYPLAVIVIILYAPKFVPILEKFPIEIFAYYFSTAIIMAFNGFAGDSYIYSVREIPPSPVIEYIKRRATPVIELLRRQYKKVRK